MILTEVSQHFLEAAIEFISNVCMGKLSHQRSQRIVGRARNRAQAFPLSAQCSCHWIPPDGLQIIQ